MPEERTLSLPSPYVKVGLDPGLIPQNQQSATSAVRDFLPRAGDVVSSDGP
jgi:hypothetical protein